MNAAYEQHTWAEIDLDALTDNFNAVKARAGEMPLCAVVKADSYGHGAVPCARALSAAGAKAFAVSCLSEALELRGAGLNEPILILGYTEPRMADVLFHSHITQCCFSLAYARDLNDSAARLGAGAKLSVHLKADTGMGRIGFALRTNFDAAVHEMCEVYALPHIEVTGLFQHFAVADGTSPEDTAYTAEQHALFCKAYEALKAVGHEPATVHCDNSAGVMLHPDWPLGLPRARCMARPGIILYGFDPSDEVRFGVFKPVMKLMTLVSMVKTLEPGQSTSYGRRFVAEKPTRVATLCAGYADGYPRLLSGKGIVEIHGKPANVLGRVCMDQMMVDVTDIPNVEPGDQATLWGGAVSDSAESIAEKTGTISYEVLCGVARRVPRIYKRGGVLIDTVDYLNG